jgi:hypothetical protein
LPGKNSELAAPAGTRRRKILTYKVALLRILAPIADTAGGSARREPDFVAVPMGLAALFWIRMYKRLIANAAIAAGSLAGSVSDSFSVLRPINPFDWSGIQMLMTYHFPIW